MSEKNIQMQVFNGTDYDTLYPKTKVEQVEGAYTQQQILSNATKAMFGLGSNAVPDDTFKIALNMIPSPYGLLVVRVKNSSGNPAIVSFSITPSPNGVSSGATNENGLFSVYAEPGNYSVSVDTGVFISSEVPTKTSAVRSGQITILDFIADPVKHGLVNITKSCSILVPASITSVDLFGVGGGGSGAATAVGYTHFAVSGGGGGGKTATLLSNNLAGKKLDIVIGAGGKSVSDKYPEGYGEADGVKGNSGGKTSISVDGKAILSADGGTGGSASTSGSSTSTVAGGSGGSGGGSGKPSSSAPTAGNGGSDGSNGFINGSTTGTYGGTGQGTTTRAFGESTGELFSGGGGAVAKGQYSYNAKGTGGAGGGGNGNIFEAPTSSTGKNNQKAGSGTTYGAGGGGVIGYYDDEDAYAAVVVNSGDGYQGLVRIRW